MRAQLNTRVMVVDDSEVACEAIRHALTSAGAEVVVLTSPFGFIRAVRESNPQVILLDVGLGSLSGTKLVELGRQHAPSGCAILLYSGRDVDVLNDDALSCGADGYISKGTTGPALIEAVRQWASGIRRRLPKSET